MQVTIASFTCTRCDKDNPRRQVTVYSSRLLEYRYKTTCSFCNKCRYTPIINPEG